MPHGGERILFGVEWRGSEEAVELTAHRDRLVVRYTLTFAAVLWLAGPIPRAVAQTSAAPAVLHDLAGISDLQAVFDRESDRTRIVLLLSPT
jgi:hypothetical protein